MRITKAAFTVVGCKGFRDHQLEGEAEGKLGKELILKGDLSFDKIKGLFTNQASYKAILGSLYDAKGMPVTTDLGAFKLNCEGVCCKITMLYGLTDTHELEECSFDKITITPQEGKVANVKARLRLHPKVNLLGKIDQWLKNQVTLTLNGQTVAADQEDEDDEQPELGLNAPEDGEDDDVPPAAGPGEVLPGVPAVSQEDLKRNAESVEQLRKDGVLAGPKATGKAAAKPSTAHGEVVVPGGKPPQRPRRPPGGNTLQ